MNLKNTPNSVRSGVKSIEKVIVVRRTGSSHIKMQEDDIYFDDFLNQINEGIYPLPMEGNEPGSVI